jgi:hypothetical protein
MVGPVSRIWEATSGQYHVGTVLAYVENDSRVSDRDINAQREARIAAEAARPLLVSGVRDSGQPIAARLDTLIHGVYR